MLKSLPARVFCIVFLMLIYVIVLCAGLVLTTHDGTIVSKYHEWGFNSIVVEQCRFGPICATGDYDVTSVQYAALHIGQAIHLKIHFSYMEWGYFTVLQITAPIFAIIAACIIVLRRVSGAFPAALLFVFALAMQFVAACFLASAY